MKTSQCFNSRMIIKAVLIMLVVLAGIAIFDAQINTSSAQTTQGRIVGRVRQVSVLHESISASTYVGPNANCPARQDGRSAILPVNLNIVGLNTTWYCDPHFRDPENFQFFSTQLVNSNLSGRTVTFTAPEGYECIGWVLTTDGIATFSPFNSSSVKRGSGGRECQVTNVRPGTIIQQDMYLGSALGPFPIPTEGTHLWFEIQPTPTYTLTVNSSGASGVSLSGSPSTYGGSTNYTRSVANGTTFSITAPATSGSATFASWNGCNSGSANRTCDVSMTSDRTVTVNYSVQNYTLTVNSSGASNVAIAGSPSTYYGGSTNYTRSVANGTTFSITAPATSGSATFASWTGCSSTGGTTCNLTMDANRTVTANYVVSITPLPTASISVSPNPVPYAGTAGFTLSSTNAYYCYVWVDDYGYIYQGYSTSGTWYKGPFKSSGPHRAAASCYNDGFKDWSGWSYANFTVNPFTPTSNYHTLTVNSSGASSVSILSSDTYGGITNYTSTVGNGTSLSLTAPATTGAGAYTFSGWTGCSSTSGTTCERTMDANRTVTANYIPTIRNYTLTTSINSGSGTITGPGINCPGDCSDIYTAGTWVTLIATPSSGYTFNNWLSGSGTICGGQGGTCSALIDGNKTARANFDVDMSPPPFDYTLSNSGTSNVTKTSGNAFTQNTINKALTSGDTQSVTLSLSGLPNGTSYSISNSSCSPSCTSVITFTVASNTSVGTYPITVTGSPLNKRTNFNLVVSGNPMTVSCSPSPTATALLGQIVTWTATISGGTPPLTYSWSGTNIPTNPAPNTNPFNISYSTIGQKNATATVTDADSLQATCSPGTVQINFDPRFEEF